MFCSRVPKFPIGTNIRRKFDDGWFDGVVIQVDVRHKLWKVKYTDSDVEDMDEGQMITYTSKYNQKYNTK